MFYLAAILLIAAVALFGLRLASMQFNKTILGGLVNTNQNLTVTGDSLVYANNDVAVAQPATLTTMASSTTGSLTMTNTGHGIVTGQRFDLYWNGGQCYGCIAGTVSGLVVPIASVSGGTALPASGTAVTVGIITTVPFSFIGNNLQALVFAAPVAGYFVVNDGSTDCLAQYVTPSNAYNWYVGGGTNPLSGKTVTKVYMSQIGTAAIASSQQAQALVT